MIEPNAVYVTPSVGDKPRVRHFPDPKHHGSWSLCGRAETVTVVEHARRRARWGVRPVDYESLPVCAFCMKASKR